MARVAMAIASPILIQASERRVGLRLHLRSLLSGRIPLLRRRSMFRLTIARRLPPATSTAAQWLWMCLICLLRACISVQTTKRHRPQACHRLVCRNGMALIDSQANCHMGFHRVHSIQASLCSEARQAPRHRSIATFMVFRLHWCRLRPFRLLQLGSFPCHLHPQHLRSCLWVQRWKSTD